MNWGKAWNKAVAAGLCLLGLSLMTACQSTMGNTDPMQGGEQTDGTVSVNSTQTEVEESAMRTIRIIVGEQQFVAELYDNSTARTFAGMLPLTVTMEELNGNEKYYYLPDDLPVNATVPSSIHAGDLMLFGSDCLVLFYQDFSTSYSYTPLGHVQDAAGLERACGRGSVQVTFSLPALQE